MQEEGDDRPVLLQQFENDVGQCIVGECPRVLTDNSIHFGNTPKTTTIHLVNRAGTTLSITNVND